VSLWWIEVTLQAVRTLGSRRQRRREAWELARTPRTMKALLEAVPGLTDREVRRMLDRKQLVRVDGLIRAVTPEPRHKPPPQAVLAPSVWAYARRCA
jgi:hypothetical protein